ncbi:N-acetylmuramoyl-L-alanine amidase [Mesorhizobium sp. M1403]|uniref:N-acetylmuramoyl-L-alanine amidase n=1 Tax=Mesorhizobium sp. M1403 TaxID=2957097 RepID=UPI0033377259
MRPIDTLIWHCAATPEGKFFDISDVDRWHRERGFSGVGYHKIVLLDGKVQEGRAESVIGAHVAGHNTGSIGYSYIGGVSADGKTAKDTRTAAQKVTMKRLTVEAVHKYPIKRIAGHNEYASKACPSFDVRKDELGNIEGFKGGRKA